MSDLGMNKIFGAVLATGLIIMGANELPGIVFGSGGGHGGGYGDDHGEETSKYAYYQEIISVDPDAPVEVFDLGLALASADVDRGERSFRAKCASCHTVEQGGANGTGPNLWNVMGRDVGGVGSFGYSGAMAEYPGDWEYQNMYDYLENPRGYISGTAMSFAGLKKQPERVNVVAYLSTLATDQLPFPEPLPAPEADIAVDGEEIIDGAEVVDTTVNGDVGVVESVQDVIDEVTEAPGE